MKLTLTSLLAAGLLFPGTVLHAAPDASAPKVQLALLLDTSGSMEGLIHQARAQLWKIVNEFNTAKRQGQTPELEVALFEYGNDSLSADRHWVRQITPLTRDLDEVSRRLFALSTNGGSEYCGAVIREATQSLTWSNAPGTYKAIFVAGNEPFTQGPVSSVEACRAALGCGIVVNTIHCGGSQDGINGGWQQGAMLAEGSYLCIDQDKAIAHVPCPQDAEIVKLSADLNKTYCGYGALREEKAANQIAQDKNATAAAPSAPVSRALTKASANYDNSKWDLVDAVTKDKVDPATVKKSDLPEELRALNEADLKAHVTKLAAERTAVQEKIRILSQAREAFLATQAKAPGGPDTLDTAVAKAVRQQAAKAGFEWR
jgi:von Willebrand factor type A domain